MHKVVKSITSRKVILAQASNQRFEYVVIPGAEYNEATRYLNTRRHTGKNQYPLI